MSKYYIQLVNDELPAPMYVERGLGFGGVKITGNIRAAKRYDTEAEAEKIAALARAQKDKERGGETTTVEIVCEDRGDGWESRASFSVHSSGSESSFQMKKTDAGIVSRFVGMDGNVSKEYSSSDLRKAVLDWVNSSGAWFAAKVTGGKT